jgi:hypothetical protein
VSAVLDSVDPTTPVGLRDRAVLLLMARRPCAPARWPDWSLTMSTGATARSSSVARAVVGTGFSSRSMSAKRSWRMYTTAVPGGIPVGVLEGARASTKFLATTKTTGLSRERWKASDYLYRAADSVPSKVFLQ